MILEYFAVFYPYELGVGYTVEFPDLPGCVTQGESFEEALAMAKDAASGWVSSSVEDGEDIPLASNNISLTQFKGAVSIHKISVHI